MCGGGGGACMLCVCGCVWGVAWTGCSGSPFTTGKISASGVARTARSVDQRLTH